MPIYQFKRGTTVANDAYTGPVASLTVDLDEQLIRLHDGVTAGGKVIGKSSPDFDNTILWVSHTRTAQFDVPTLGDITEEIRLTAGSVLVASRVTEFDTPTAGDITITTTFVGNAPVVSVFTFVGDDSTEVIS